MIRIYGPLSLFKSETVSLGSRLRKIQGPTLLHQVRYRDYYTPEYAIKMHGS